MAVFSSLLYLAFALLLAKFLLNQLAKRRDAKKARQLGCLPVYDDLIPWWDPLNLVKLRNISRVAQSQKLCDYFVDREETLTRKMGHPVMTLGVGVLGSRSFFTSDPVNIQAFLAKQFHDYELGPVRIGNMGPLLGTGIFTSDGKAWEHSRAMLRPNFARERISALDLEHQHCSNLMLALPVKPDGWTSPVDLLPLFFRLTLDSSTQFLFGVSTGSQIAELADKSVVATGPRPGQREIEFAAAFDRAQYWISRRGRLGPRYWLVNPKEFKESCKKCHEFIDYYVQLALQKRMNVGGDEKDSNREYVFLDELAQQTRDPLEIRSQLLSILLAGRDTTASMLGWMFYLLARHPDVFSKLRATILEEFGPYGDQPDSISFASLKGCQYLQHCLNETLRLYPVVPLNARRSSKDTTLPRGGGPDGQSPVFIKKGTGVGYSVFVMQRNKQIWGEDADEFKPERWAGRKPGWEFLPFNGGPRVCIGQQFALTSAGFAVVRLLQRFDRIENLDPENEVKQALTLTSCPGTGVQVRLHEAASSEK